MRQQRSSSEYSRQFNQNENFKRYNDSEISDIEDQNAANCPLVFKTCLLLLITSGILVFVIWFAVGLINTYELSSVDFSKCPDQSNVRRLQKSYVYEKMILGLSVSGLVLAFGLLSLLTMHLFKYYGCFDDCRSESEDESQYQSREEINMQRNERQVKRRIASNIEMPQPGMARQQPTQMIVRKSNLRQQFAVKSSKKRFHKQHYHKSKKQIEEFNKKYSKYIRQTEDNQYQISCDDCASCLVCCLGCLWCRICFQAHHFRYYHSKAQQYTYWITYMLKTLFFGSALAYFIRIYVSLREIEYCLSSNSKSYVDSMEVPLIVGIVTASLDIFGYIHLFIEGTLLDFVKDTIDQKRKSQHSDSDSDDESLKGNSKAKYRSSSENDQGSQKRKRRSIIRQNSISYEQYKKPSKPSRDYLIKEETNNPKQTEIKDTDSFFIKLKSLGNRYLDSIDDEFDLNESRQGMKKQKNVISEGPNKKSKVENERDRSRLKDTSSKDSKQQAVSSNIFREVSIDKIVFP